VKKTHGRPSTTSLPTSPEDAAAARSKKYLIMMGIRILCVFLMVVVTPYGWYTAVFGIAAIFLPYVAVVMANVGDDASELEPEHPEFVLTEKPAPKPEAPPAVIQVRETPAVKRRVEEG